MKLEIEVTEEEIKSAIACRVRVAIANLSNAFQTDVYIKREVKRQVPPVIDDIIIKCLQQTPALEAKVIAQIEATMKRRTTALMKAGKK